MKKSSLLIQEPLIAILPSLAVAIGLNGAIIVQQLHYWLDNPKVGVQRDGHKWIFNTYEEWQENFPFWSVSTIKRTFLELEKEGLIISAQLDANKHDQTKFYRLDYDKLCTMDEVKLSPSKNPEWYDDNKKAETTTETSKAEKNIVKEADKKMDAILGMLGMSGLKKEQRYLQYESLVKVKTGIEPTRKKWQDLFDFVDKQPGQGKDLETFLNWLVLQAGFDIQYWPADRMREFWPMAFTTKPTPPPAVPVQNLDDIKAVPYSQWKAQQVSA